MPSGPPDEHWQRQTCHGFSDGEYVIGNTGNLGGGGGGRANSARQAVFLVRRCDGLVIVSIILNVTEKVHFYFKRASIATRKSINAFSVI